MNMFQKCYLTNLTRELLDDTAGSRENSRSRPQTRAVRDAETHLVNRHEAGQEPGAALTGQGPQPATPCVT